MSGFRYAFSLSKDEVQQARPQGTAQLFEHDIDDSRHGVDRLLLVPQPSSDPADPLNYATWRKLMILVCICLYPLVGNIASASLSSALPFLAMEFNPPVAESNLSHLIAVNVLMMGAANIWWVPLANVFGRRPVILIGLLTLTLCSVWTAKATTFNSLLAGRIFQGIGIGPADTICPAVLGEIYFRHQRGRAMAIYTVFLALGPLVGGIMGSYIAAAHGWRWTQWVNVILSGFTLLVCLLFQAETLFDRDGALAREFAVQQTAEKTDENTTLATPEKSEMDHQEQVARPFEHKPFTFAQSLSIGVNRGGLVKQFVAPWLTLRFPGVWLVMLHYAGLVGGIVTMSTVGPEFVSEPPYLWGANAGLINIGGVIGAILGLSMTFVMADRSLKRQAHRQAYGLSEPESRLPAMFPGLFLAATGLWTFGFCGANPSQYGWVGLQFGSGMLVFGVMQVPSIGFNYIIESYHAVSGDCFVMVTCLRAIISFAWTFFVSEWIEKSGAAEPFGIFGMLMAIFGLLTLVIYFYGKRIRIATQKWLPESKNED